MHQLVTPSRHHPGELLILGETTYRRTQHRFGLLPEDRLRHLWLVGKTGSGKSTLLANLVAQDLAAGRGLALLDPHGDLVESVLPLVPRSRTNDVLVFDPEDRDWPVSFNPFRRGRQPHADPALLASQLISVFKKHWGDSWGPRLEHILRNAILAIADHPKATILFLYRFLTDEPLRLRVVETIRDPVVRAFWVKEFAGYGKSLQAEALAAVQNKLGGFVSHPTVRNIVSQERSRVDFIDLMNSRGIMLASLASGRIGEDASHLLGGLLLTSIQLAAMERPRGNAPLYVYVDEFQSFVTESIATMLSEARKFGLGLTLSHQYLAQLPLSIRDAVLGNVGSTMLFRLGGDDANRLADDFMPFSAADLQMLNRYHVAVKLLARGETLRPFSAQTLAAPAAPADPGEIAARIRAASRRRFAMSRSDLETAVARSLGEP